MALRLPTITQKVLRKPPVIMKIVPKVTYEMFLLVDFSCKQWRKSSLTEKGLTRWVSVRS
jgi:hypothetical protein